MSNAPALATHQICPEATGDIVVMGVLPDDGTGLGITGFVTGCVVGTVMGVDTGVVTGFMGIIVVGAVEGTVTIGVVGFLAWNITALITELVVAGVMEPCRAVLVVTMDFFLLKRCVWEEEKICSFLLSSLCSYTCIADISANNPSAMYYMNVQISQLRVY